MRNPGPGAEPVTGDAVEGTPLVELTLDGRTERVARGRRLIEVARERGGYVPGWCHHPGMRPSAELEAAETVYRPVEGPVARRVGTGVPEGTPVAGVALEGRTGAPGVCGMCAVEVDGELVRACEARARAGMAIRTSTDAARERQREAMAALFRHHPHACLDCAQKEGCDRITCSMNVPPEERCCDLLGNCELEKSAEAVGLDWSRVPPYEPLGRPAQAAPVMQMDWELCVGCLRCVGVCQDHVGAGVWRFTLVPDGGGDRDAPGRSDAAEPATGSRGAGAGGGDGGRGAPGLTVGLKAETLQKAGCKLCTACVEACPTGALMDPGGRAPDGRLPVEFRRSLPPVPFPRRALPLERGIVEAEVPAAAGVYTLYDGDGEVLGIHGVADLARELLGEAGRGEAAEFEFELAESFTRRETELIERYVNRHGHMPGAGGMMDDLF